MTFRKLNKIKNQVKPLCTGVDICIKIDNCLWDDCGTIDVCWSDKCAVDND